MYLLLAINKVTASDPDSESGPDEQLPPTAAEIDNSWGMLAFW
jgi:hypothetical protein